jgi:hypothetical protein
MGGLNLLRIVACHPDTGAVPGPGHWTALLLGLSLVLLGAARADGCRRRPRLMGGPP